MCVYCISRLRFSGIGARGHRNGETRTSLSATTMPRLTGPLKFRSFWPRTTWQWSPPLILTRSGPLWLFSLPHVEASNEGSKIRHQWRDSRGIAEGTWHSSKKGLPGVFPSMAETLGLLYSCKRGVLWRWWRNLTSKVSKLLFTCTVLELLDTSLYITSDAIYNGSAGMTLYYYMCRSWQNICRRGWNRSWPSVSVESIDSECWCLNNAIFYAFIMRLTEEERVFILESYLQTTS